MNIVITRILNDIKLVVHKLKWRKKNRHNNTNAANIFLLDKVTVGKGTYGTLRVIDYGNGKNRLNIGNYCSIAEEVTFLLAGEHVLERSSTFPWEVHCFGEKPTVAGSKGDIVVGDDVWIGYRATVMSGITIGQGAVIAAGSVVTKDVEPYAVVGGNPCRLIKYRFEENIRKQMKEIDWNRLDHETICKNKECLLKNINSENVMDTIAFLRS